MVLTLGPMALAQDDPTTTQRQPAWGTTSAPGADSIQFESALEPVNARITYVAAQYGSGGVGLRNRNAGAISVSGVLTPTKAAYIYWAVITTGAATAPNKTIKLQRLSPTPVSAVATITGTLLATGATPCWAGNTISVFRGIVPLTVATGNGLYQVTLLAGASGVISGADPWVGTPKLPLMEGASLVIVGTAPSGTRVVIYDAGLAGHTFRGDSGLSYSLTLPVAAKGTLTLFDNIGADGQIGNSRRALAGNANERTIINGVGVAGPSSVVIDSDWNGISATPLPQLWDDSGHDITAATPSGTTELNFQIFRPGSSATIDCMTTVANIIEVQ